MTTATNDTRTLQPGEEDARLTARADFGVFVTDAASFPRENRGFSPVQVDTTHEIASTMRKLFLPNYLRNKLVSKPRNSVST